MKYAAIFFDWGDTLSPLDPNGTPILNGWAHEMIRRLYDNSYRLGIISNTHRYQDAYWIRNELARRNLLQCFEVVISSATYAIHKPSIEIFDKAVNFMQVDPRKAVMVGDSERCDGAAQYLRSKYLKVKPGENWGPRLYALLEEEFKPGRKLTPVFEYVLHDDSVLVTTKRHLSEPLAPGDRFVVDQDEYRVVDAPPMTKEEILKAKDEFVEIIVEKV